MVKIGEQICHISDCPNPKCDVVNGCQRQISNPIPSGWLYTLMKPGKQTQYASISPDERHVETSDEEWLNRKMDPLYKLEDIDDSPKEGKSPSKDFIDGWNAAMDEMKRLEKK